MPAGRPAPSEKTHGEPCQRRGLCRTHRAGGRVACEMFATIGLETPYVGECFALMGENFYPRGNDMAFVGLHN